MCVLLMLCLPYVVLYILLATPSQPILPPLLILVLLMEEGVKKRNNVQHNVFPEHVEEEHRINSHERTTDNNTY